VSKNQINLETFNKFIGDIYLDED